MVESQLIIILHKNLSCKANYLPCSVSSRMPGPTKWRRRTFTAVYMCNISVVHWDGKGGLTLPVTMVIKTNSVFTPYPLSKYVYARTNIMYILNAIQWLYVWNWQAFFFYLTNHDQHLQLNLKTFLAKHCINTDNKFRQEAFKLFVNIHYIDKLGQKKNI